MAEDNEQVVRRAYEVAEDKDLAGWVELGVINDLGAALER